MDTKAIKYTNLRSADKRQTNLQVQRIEDYGTQKSVISKSSKSVSMKKRALGDITNSEIGLQAVNYRRGFNTNRSVNEKNAEKPANIAGNFVHAKFTDPKTESLSAHPINSKKKVRLETEKVHKSSAGHSQKQKKCSATSEAKIEKVLDLIDIDKDDWKNSLYSASFAKLIHLNLRDREKQFVMPQNSITLLEKNRGFSAKMRNILIDWLVDVHYKYRLKSETLFLCVGLLNCTVSHCKMNVTRKNLQLVGMVCLWVASKFEDTVPPDISDLVYVCDNAYDKEDIILTESKVLNNLDFDINIPISYTFLKRTLKVLSKLIDAENNEKGIRFISSLSRYVVELSWLHLPMLQFKPSIIAAASVRVAARIYIINYDSNDAWVPVLDWDNGMKLHLGCSLHDLIDCENTINLSVIESAKAKKGYLSKLTALQRKFNSSKYGNISTNLPNLKTI